MNEGEQPAAGNSDVIIGHIRAVDADLPPFNNVTYVLDRRPSDLDYTSPATSAPFPFRLSPTTINDTVVAAVVATSGLLDRERRDHFRFVAQATGPGCATPDVAVIEVGVADVNDNNPVFVFPAAAAAAAATAADVRGDELDGDDDYNTVHVGTEFRPEIDVVTTLKAVDRDLGENARVRYQLLTAESVAGDQQIQQNDQRLVRYI